MSDLNATLTSIWASRNPGEPFEPLAARLSCAVLDSVLTTDGPEAHAEALRIHRGGTPFEVLRAAYEQALTEEFAWRWSA